MTRHNSLIVALILAILLTGCAPSKLTTKAEESKPREAGDAVVTPLPREPFMGPFSGLPEKYAAAAKTSERQGNLRKALLQWTVVNAFRPDHVESRKRMEALRRQIEVLSEAHRGSGREALERNDVETARMHFRIAEAFDVDGDLSRADRLLSARTGRDTIVYVAKEGDTLRTIAGEVYGDPGADVIVAWFGDLSVDDTVTAGTLLRLPSIASVKTPNSDPAKEMVGKANALVRNGKYSEAGQVADRILTQDPTRPSGGRLKNDVNYQIGTDLLQKKEYREALKMFRNVDSGYRDREKKVAFVEGLIREAEQHYVNGVRLFTAEKLEDAVMEWEKALQIDPGHGNAKRDLEKAKRLLSKLKDIR